MRLRVDGPAGVHEAYIYTGGKSFDAALPTVVFVHGAMHDHSVWTLLARWFAHHGHGVLAPDLPGHSQSAGPPLQSVEAIAGWLLALVKAAGVAEASFVGHSMGSLVTLEAAAQAPAQAKHLAMVGTAYPMVVSPALLEAARNDPFAAIDSVNAFSHSTLASKPSYPGPGMWLHGANRALMRRLQTGQRQANLFLQDFEVCNRYAGGLSAAARVTCPTTLILGEHDQMTGPKQTTEIARALRAHTVKLPAGHALMSEAPDALLDALRAALAIKKP
ncbi:MAG: alpha/beta hydrolase [Caldimonas sp.]|nr:alpha/beta hydrolase [Pseudomonadota bacterium]